MTAHTYNLDAKDQKLGRFATEIAVLLMGKQLPDFARNVVPDVKVTVTNASLMNISDKKKEQKTYSRYSGYPGGRKTMSMQEVIDKKGYEALIQNAVYGMLPTNKLRPIMMKNLIINE